MDSVDLMFSGRVLPGADANRAAADLARLTGLDVGQALQIITSGSPRLAMQGLTPEHAKAWLSRLTAIGIEASLQASSIPATRSWPPPPEAPPQAPTQGPPQAQGVPPGSQPGYYPPQKKSGCGCWLPALIGCGVLALFGVAGLFVAIPQFAQYRMRAFNSSAESELRNLATNQAVFFTDHMTYGSTMEGALPGTGDSDDTEYLVGPMAAATGTTRGAMLSGTDRGGKKVGMGIAVSSNVGLMATGTPALFLAVSKHRNGDRIFLTTSETASVFFCRNSAWINEDDLDSLAGFVWGEDTVVAILTSDPGKVRCGGSPNAYWQAL